jgi:hypothetical protein
LISNAGTLTHFPLTLTSVLLSAMDWMLFGSSTDKGIDGLLQVKRRPVVCIELPQFQIVCLDITEASSWDSQSDDAKQ